MTRARRVALGLAVILVAFAAGQSLATWLELPIPGSVAGMLLLAGALRAGVVPLELVQPASALLIRWMALFFVPAGVGLLVHLGLLRANLLALTLAALASIVAVLLVVGLTVQRMAGDE